MTSISGHRYAGLLIDLASGLHADEGRSGSRGRADIKLPRLKELRVLIREHSRNATIGIGLGLPMSVTGQIIGHDIIWAESPKFSPNHWALVFGLAGIGAILFFYGCCQYAMAKELSGAWGLLGLFCGLLGLAVIVLLPDRSLRARRSQFVPALPAEEQDEYEIAGITVQVVFFADLRNRAGVDRAEFVLPMGATVLTAMDAVAERFPALRLVVRKARCAVNNDAANRLAQLDEGDELALFPAPART